MKITSKFKTQLLEALRADYTHIASVKSSTHATVLPIILFLISQDGEHISFPRSCEKPIAEFQKENPDAKIIYYDEVIS